MKAELTKARDGSDIIEVTKEGQVLRLNSNYKPIAEAEKFAKQYETLHTQSVLFVFGFGNGNMPEALAHVCEETNSVVVFYEPSEEIAACTKQILPYQTFCNVHKKCVVVSPFAQDSGDNVYYKERFFDVLDSYIHYINRDYIKVTALPKYEELFPDLYRDFCAHIEDRLHTIAMDETSAKWFGEIAVKNSIDNLAYLKNAYCGDSLKKLFCNGETAIIVSAGPSLEKNIDVLKMAKGKFFILCVDTAIKYVLEHEVIPDMIISIDPRKSLVYFEDDRIQGIPVAGITDMSTEVLNIVRENPIYFVGTENPYIRNMVSRAGHDLWKLDYGGSVSTAAYQLCVQLEFKTIVFVGLDLAFTKDKQYPNSNVINRSSYERKLYTVEAVDGGTVYTTEDYLYYLKWFGEHIKREQGIRIIDATEGGAKIEGTEVMSLLDVVEQFGIDYLDYGQAFGQISPIFDGDKETQFNEEVLVTKKNLSQIESLLRKGIRFSEEGMELLRKRITIPDRYQKVDNGIAMACNAYEKYDEVYFIQKEIEATKANEFACLVNQITDETLDLMEYYTNMKTYFSMLLEALKQVRRLFEKLDVH